MNSPTRLPDLSHPEKLKMTDLPFVKNTRKGRCFWSVSPTGNYDLDYQTGVSYAAMAADYLRASYLKVFITWIVSDLIKQKASKNGVVDGFFFFLGEYIHQHPRTPGEALIRHEMDMRVIRNMVRAEKTKDNTQNPTLTLIETEV